jgi:hypothetical protein
MDEQDYLEHSLACIYSPGRGGTSKDTGDEDILRRVPLDCFSSIQKLDMRTISPIQS